MSQHDVRLNKKEIFFLRDLLHPGLPPNSLCDGNRVRDREEITRPLTDEEAAWYEKREFMAQLSAKLTEAAQYKNRVRE